MIDLDKSGYATSLLEQISVPAIYSAISETYERPLFQFNIPPYIQLTSVNPIRYLSVEEQRVFEHSLRRSVKIVHKARRSA